ncbi:MAG: DUF2272 domain-containing protein [Candidatus Methylumidiphilus sp.]
MSRGISTNQDISAICHCLQSKGIKFVCRYYSFTTHQTHKRLTLPEANAILAEGMQIVTVYEDGPTNPAYFSKTRGESDGKHAHDSALALGQPSGSAIYFAVDYDASKTDTLSVITEYFEGVQRGLATANGGAALYDVGVYGSGRVCSHIKEIKSLAKYSWLAESHGWAGHAAYPNPDIRQEIATTALCGLAAGVGGGYEDNFVSNNFGAFSSLGAATAPALVSPPIAVPTPISATSAYAKAVAALAEDQYQKYHLFSEDDDTLAKQIRDYWEDIGFTFPGVKTFWSAIFVSWIMRTAGASANEFKASSAHSRFVFWAIDNLKNNSGLFHAHRIDDYAPHVGDIIQNNRDGQNLTYDFAAAHKAYSSHAAVVVEIGSDATGKFAITVGGNESDSVRRKRVALHSDGTVKQRASSSYICVIQNLKA